MGVRNRRRVGAVLVVGVVAASAFLLVVRDDERPSEDGFDLPEGHLLVPDGDVREYQLTRVGATEPLPLDDGAGPLVVVRHEGHVVSVTSSSEELARHRHGDLLPDPRQATIGGRPTVDYGWQLSPVTGTGRSIAWFESDERIAQVSSRTLGLDGLVGLAEQVEAHRDGRLDVPGELIGEIPSSWSASRPGTTAVFERRDEGVSRRIEVSILAADRSAQDAYLALAAPDGSIDGRTVASCCQSPIPPRRSLEVDGRDAIAAALDADHHMVVLPGDHGAVLLVPGGRFESVPRDVWLTELAESLRPVPADELEPFEESLRPPG